MQARLDRAQFEFSEKQQKLDEREQELTERLAAAENPVTDESEIQTLVSDRDKLTTEVECVRTELNAVSQQYQSVFEQLNKEQQQIRTLEAKLAEANETSAAVEAGDSSELIAKLQTERDELQEAVELLQEQLANDSTESDGSTQGTTDEEIESLQNQLETAKRDLEYRDDKLESLHDEITADRTEWEDAKKQLEEKIEELKAGGTADESDATEVQEELKRQSEEIDQRATRLDARSEELAKREQSVEESQKSVTEERNQLRELRRELELARVQFGTEAGTTQTTSGPDVFAESAEEVKNNEEGETHIVALRSELAEMFGIDEVETRSDSAAPEPEAATEAPSPFGAPAAEPEKPKVTSFLPADDGSSPFGATAAANAAEAPAPLPEIPALETAGAAAPAEDANYVEAYMEKLLARTRGDAAIAPVAATPQTPAADATGTSGDGTDLNAEPTPDEEPKQPRKRVNKDLVRANMNSFREVANQSAKSAIERHAWKKNKNKLATRAILTAIAFLFGLILTVLHLVGSMDAAHMAIFFLMIGTIGCIHLLYSLRKIRLEASELLTDKTANQDQLVDQYPVDNYAAGGERSAETPAAEEEEEEFVLTDVENYLGGNQADDSEQQ